MRKKLTVLGVLSALALGAATLFGGGSASAGTGGPIQNFNVSNAICYGSAPAIGVLGCPGTSATVAPSSSSAATYQVTNITDGSRLTLPVLYTPGAFAFTPGAALANVGDVTSSTDLLCDGSVDVLAGGPDTTTPWNSWDSSGDTSGTGDPIGVSGGEGVAAPWPNSAVWKPYPFFHQGVAPVGKDSYVTAIKPTPASFTAVSHDKADLFTLWLGKTTGLFLPSIQNGLPTPLNTITETSPYVAGLRVSVTLLAGNPSPPSNSFTTCLDSRQDSVARNTQITTPTTTGLYPRWTVYTSAVDERGGNVSRVIDVNCLQVNGPLTDTDGDCIEGGAGDLAGADSDGDFVVDGVEAANGSNPALADTDGDGASDLDEMAQFTNPNVADTDGDGSADKFDNGADEGTPDDTAADDNCPAIANAAQTNSDFANDYNGTVAGDATVNNQDSLGDACDTDDDNDRMSDAAEGGLFIAPALTASGFCKPDTAGGAVSNPTNTTNDDTDDDLGLDGAECKFDSNPQSSASNMAVQPGDNLADGAPETFYRTQKINKPGGGQESNPDADALTTGDADSDSDNDGLSDGLEVKFYGTHPSNDDSDNDACKDGTEAASVDGSGRSVNSIDLGQVAQRFGAYVPANETILVPAGRVAYDYTKNKTIDAIDLGQVAQRFGSCGVQAGITIVKGNTIPQP